MKNYQVKLYRKGVSVAHIVLTLNAKNRHEVEEIARKYILNGHADSMGAIDEISN